MISTSQLHASLRFHTWPIDLVVYEDPYLVDPVGNLILERVSCLDAFSTYPIRT